VATYSRINARAGNVVNLNMRVLKNGQLQSPHALREINIYRGSIRPGNIVATIAFPDPADVAYPTPATELAEGEFVVPFFVPEDFVTCDQYFDVWSFVGEDPGTPGVDDTSLWISQYGTFHVYDDVWISDDELRTLKVGFEPLDKRLRRGELRTIEIAIHPLPLYDYNYNVLTPIIPQLSPTITIHTAYDELIVSDSPCLIGVRQGRGRNSPYVIQCLFDTTTLIRGMYRYTVKVMVGDQTIISPRFYLTIQ
jgi:hypothetical protein